MSKTAALLEFLRENDSGKLYIVGDLNVPGNHDEQVVRYLGTCGSIAVQKNATHTRADGRRILVFHGHELDGCWFMTWAGWGTLAILDTPLCCGATAPSIG
jgi:UDP-2,3-diacylglucosamine pyrophosphatase LpxH